jgi:uncharacterized protein (DUF1786 family)
MSKFLLIDVGAGTMDVLSYDDATGVHYKAVVKSPVQYISERASSLPGNLLISGREMGGGRLSEVLRNRSRTAEVLMTHSSALTISHQPDKVRSLGIRLIKDEEAMRLSKREDYSNLMLGDIQIDHLGQIVKDLGVPFEFDVLGICAQDHGMPPEGVSHLDHRHRLFKDVLDKTPSPLALLYTADEVPHTFNRLRSIAETGGALSVRRVYVMDSGMAAILGASMDFEARKRRNILVLDVATSHTVGAALADGELAGFFEYHTRDITAEKLDLLIRGLADGKLDHEQILREGGHGAYMRRTLGFDSIEMIVATGPKRRLVENSRLPITYGAPFGDNMMTGTVGLLEAIRRREGKPPIIYL